MQASSKNREIDAITAKILKKRHDFLQMIAEKALFMSKDYEKDYFHQKIAEENGISFQRIAEKMLFPSNDHKKDSIFIKRLWKKHDFCVKIAEKL